MLEPMPSFVEIFYHSTHRIDRMRFIAAAAVLVSVWALAGMIPVPFIASTLKVLVGYSALCVLSLRLHDCGRSGWWSWLVLGALVFADKTHSPAAALAWLPVIVLSLWPGQKGLNRHGPAPAPMENQASG